MVIKELYELWRKDNLLTQALNDVDEMLTRTERMFTESVKSLRESEADQPALDIYREDQKINKFERNVRHKVLKHLMISGATNVAPGLVLVSVVMDIERVGDYTKNILELAMAHPTKLECRGYDTDVAKIERAVAGLFSEMVAVLRESDADRARTLIQETIWIRRRCDEIVIELIKESEPSPTPGEAVTIALYVRYLKRIGAHLMNVLSSVVNPFERIGFREKQ